MATVVDPQDANHIDAAELKRLLPNAAFAFRGYNVTNLGRSAELLAHPAYGAIVRETLEQASQVCSEATGKTADLVDRVQRQLPTTMETYAEAVALIMAMEHAHMRLLEEFFDVHMADAKLALGYSLGEITAVSLAGVLELHEAMTVPIALAEDCAALAHDVSLGVLFSRGKMLPLEQVQKMCLQINQAGQGVIGVSAQLSPNSMLLMGQGDTLDRFSKRRKELPDNAHLRRNASQFPPLHTPLVWQRNIPSRAAVMMHTLHGGFTPPMPRVLSLVTGRCSYNDFNARETLRDWTDHPQLLWDAVSEILRQGIKLVVNVGPEPNIIPATLKRLRDNVESETKGSIGMRALTAVVGHPWIQPLIQGRTALLQVLGLKQLTLEDWLLGQDV